MNTTMMDPVTFQQQMVQLQAAGLPPQTMPLQQGVWVCLPQQDAVGMQRLMMTQHGQLISPMMTQAQAQAAQAQDVAARLNAGIFAVNESIGGTQPTGGQQQVATRAPASAHPAPVSIPVSSSPVRAGSPELVSKPAGRPARASVRIEVPPASPKAGSGLPPLDDSSEEESPQAGKSKKKSRKSRRRKLDTARFKTVMCRNFLKSGCAFGNECAFAHSNDEIRDDESSASPAPSPASTPTAVCGRAASEGFTGNSSPLAKKNLKKTPPNRKASIIEDPSMVRSHRGALDWRRASAAPLIDQKNAQVLALAANLRRASAPAALHRQMLLELEDEEEEE
eukprot:TRINITY_DN2554_c0_g6_i1.p1 TRINITY_DN2554_c0_g6~~TRINITY_DN2554_c0_g6_i1.p1  ORF type:complete len:357 (+),score=84.03 TRINITY_DN2554_c0_g6_i1:62-1072(+)